MSEARAVLADLLERLELSGEAWLDRVVIAGTDPVVPSRYKPGLASAVSLGAYAAGIAEIWREPDHETEVLAAGTIISDLRRKA